MIDKSPRLASLVRVTDLSQVQLASARRVALADVASPASHARESLPDTWACGAVQDVKFFDSLRSWDASEKAKQRGSNAASRLSQGGLSGAEQQRLQQEASADSASGRESAALASKLRSELAARARSFKPDCVTSVMSAP